MNSMTLKKVYIRICLIAAIILIYLLSINDIILKYNYVDAFEVNRQPFENYENDIVYNSVLTCINNNDILESIYIEGWSFCESDIDNTNKEVGCLCCNDTDIYICSTEQFINWSGVEQAFLDKRVTNRNGFEINASTIKMPYGSYDMYIYNKENTQNYGVMPIQYRLIKSKNGVKIDKWTSTRLNDITKKDIIYDAETITQDPKVNEDGTINIDGWIWIENCSSNNQIVYAELSMKNGDVIIYSTLAQTRMDVADAYDNDSYTNSGFSIVLPKDEISDLNEIENINIYIDDGDRWHAGKSSFRSEKFETSMTNVKYNVKACIDNCILKDDGLLSINGWTFIEKRDTSKQDVYIKIQKKDGESFLYTTQKEERLDVAEAFDSELYNYSGFRAVLPNNIITKEDDIEKISIYISDGQKWYSTSNTIDFAFRCEKDDAICQ